MSRKIDHSMVLGRSISIRNIVRSGFLRSHLMRPKMYAVTHASKRWQYLANKAIASALCNFETPWTGERSFKYGSYCQEVLFAEKNPVCLDLSHNLLNSKEVVHSFATRFKIVKYVTLMSSPYKLGVLSNGVNLRFLPFASRYSRWFKHGSHFQELIFTESKHNMSRF